MAFKPWPGTTAAEVETTFRWDDEDQKLVCCTTSYRVANRWARAKLPVKVLGTARDGVPRSWELEVPHTGRVGDWIRVFRAAVPRYKKTPPVDPAGRRPADV